MSKARNKNQQGFSLIEIMVAIAIIGILITVAIPSYQAYIARAKNTTLDSSIAAYKAPLAIAVSQNGGIADDMALDDTGQAKYHLPPPPNDKAQLSIEIIPNSGEQSITIKATDNKSKQARQAVGHFSKNTLYWDGYQSVSTS